MNIDDIMDFLDNNLEGLEKIFINFESQLLKIISRNMTESDVVDFICNNYSYIDRKIIAKEIIDTL